MNGSCHTQVQVAFNVSGSLVATAGMDGIVKVWNSNDGALQCAVLCCSALQCVVLCCIALQCVAVKQNRQSVEFERQCVAVCRRVSQCVTVHRSVLQCVAVCCGVLQCSTVCCRALPCAAVCCRVLQ